MRKLYQPEFLEDLGTKKLLMIGVGGIGCELLKNLSCSAFKKLVIVRCKTFLTHHDRLIWTR